jgi:flagellar hook-basal body complex protein FliE
VTEHEEKKFPKSDRLDLETRARVTFAATAEDIDEEGSSGTHQESMNDQELKSYLEEIMNQVNKKQEKTSTVVNDTKENPDK